MIEEEIEEESAEEESEDSFEQVAGNGVTSIISRFIINRRRKGHQPKVYHRFHKSASTATFMISEQAMVLSEDSVEEAKVFRVDRYGSTESLLNRLIQKSGTKSPSSDRSIS